MTILSLYHTFAWEEGVTHVMSQTCFMHANGHAFPSRFTSSECCSKSGKPKRAPRRRRGAVSDASEITIGVNPSGAKKIADIVQRCPRLVEQSRTQTTCRVASLNCETGLKDWLTYGDEHGPPLWPPTCLPHLWKMVKGPDPVSFDPFGAQDCD